MTNSSSSANGKDSRIHHIVTATPVSEVGVGYQINAQPNTRYLWATSVSAPVYALETSINSSNRVRFLGNAFVRLTPIEDLPGDLHPSSRSLTTLNATTGSVCSLKLVSAKGVSWYPLLLSM